MELYCSSSGMTFKVEIICQGNSGLRSIESVLLWDIRIATNGVLFGIGGLLTTLLEEKAPNPTRLCEAKLCAII